MLDNTAVCWRQRNPLILETLTAGTAWTLARLHMVRLRELSQFEGDAIVTARGMESQLLKFDKLWSILSRVYQDYLMKSTTVESGVTDKLY